MSTMAEVLAEHRIQFEADGDFGEHAWIACSCTHLSFGDDYWTGENESDHEQHLAEALTAAGYGSIRDARSAELTQEMIRNIIAAHATNHLVDDGEGDKHFWHAVCDGCGESIAPGQHVHQAALIWEQINSRAAAIRVGEGA